MKRIRVKMVDGREESFPYYVLDHLIKKHGITAFERGDGWVEIDKDPIRKSSPQCFTGTKKRFTDFLVRKRITDSLLCR